MTSTCRDGVQQDNEEQRARTVPFWHHELRGVWFRVGGRWVLTVLLLSTFMVGTLSLYWGALSNVERNLPTLTVWVVDFDGQAAPYNTTPPFVGPIVIETIVNMSLSKYDRLGWKIMSPRDFQNDLSQVKQKIYEQHAYAAIVVNHNATALLRASVQQGNKSYDPSGAGEVIYMSARDQITYSSYILPAIIHVVNSALHAFGSEWIMDLSSNVTSQDIFRVPQAINPGIDFTFLDLRPFGPAVASPSITVGLVYLIIFSFFSFPFFMPLYDELISRDHPRLRPSHMITLRIIATMGSYLSLSFCFSLVSVLFHIPFSHHSASETTEAVNPDAYGKGSFFIVWMLNWVGMAALGLPSENMTMFLGMPWNALWLIFWVLSNVSTAFNSLDLAPGFFRWGYVWPLHRSM
ncbi:hypothetical protein Egran_00143 [Elaphomyces granulatus]|uniref:DUF3533 domain-containing protein n=1 Tax=Elaphomyces granulatus TaxID=519963 RepID=A0A232M6U3_9EURO|nr:hypothetical protein Egran_00143 [Elaphomyces granulatus]